MKIVPTRERKRVIEALVEINDRAVAETQADWSLPHQFHRMMALHAGKPWVPGFLSVVIAPMRPGLEEYLGPEIVQAHDIVFFYPSAQFWISHARQGHPPFGGGCNLKTHLDLLSVEQQNPEFAYANVMWSGDIYLLGDDDFADECRFWYAQIRVA